MSYLLHVIVLINLIAVLALSLNIVVGFTGLLSVCHTAFFAIGAYSTAILLLKFHWDWSATCLAAISVTLLVAFVVGRFPDSLDEDANGVSALQHRPVR